MNNRIIDNPVGRSQKCIFIIVNNDRLKIDSNVWISQTAIVCKKEIRIGNNVKIGGGVCIYDTDFHSINSEIRINAELDSNYAKIKEIIIHDNVFYLLLGLIKLY